MAQWTAVQADFSGGAISSKMVMRADIEAYGKSMLQMINFAPTLQGTMLRTPGTRHAGIIRDPATGELAQKARLIPYSTPANQRVLMVLTSYDTGTQIINGIAPYNNLEDVMGVRDVSIVPLSANGVGVLQTEGISPTLVNRTPNGSFLGGLNNWLATPEEYMVRIQGGETGGGIRVLDTGTSILIRPVLYKNPTDVSVCTLSNVGSFNIIPELNPVGPQIDFSTYYGSNPFPNGGFSVNLKVGIVPGGDDIVSATITEEDLSLGAVWRPFTRLEWNQTFADPSLPVKVYMTLTYRATKTDQQDYSLPGFTINRMRIFAFVPNDITLDDVVGSVPYDLDQLDTIQYVQSPYVNKEMVLVQPNHPPQEILFSGTDYTIQPKPFKTDAEPPIAFDPWPPGNYPSAVTSYLGRLVLAGAQTFLFQGQNYVSANTETVWCTKVGNWNKFSDDTTVQAVNPDDSIIFNTIYRSSIQWVFGHKDLLIGANEMEYIASADGIFRPGDLGVELHSTHGSSSVQPVGFGETVLFPSDNGFKIRAMSKSNDDEGWVAPDMNLLNPDILQTGIKRMVRMRNPHQMCVVLLKSGFLAVLHQDTYSGVTGWSTMDMGDPVEDISVTVSKEGLDILWMVVRRTVLGEQQLHLEGINNWTDDGPGEYMLDATAVSKSDNSHFNVVEGLNHLAGKRVHVTGRADPLPKSENTTNTTRETGYLGVFGVDETGTLTMKNAGGYPLEVSACVIGRGMRCRATSLPVAAEDPGAFKRYSDISLRIRASILPRTAVVSVNEALNETANRGPERSPRTNMNVSEPVDILFDTKLTNMGWDVYQVVVIDEPLPLRVEVLGLYGKLTSNSR